MSVLLVHRSDPDPQWELQRTVKVGTGSKG